MEEASTLQTVINFLTGPAIVTFIATLVTMFIDDAKLKKAAPIVTPIVNLLAVLSGNIFKNSNKED